MEYDAQEVVDNAYRYSYKLLTYITLKYPDNKELIENMKNMLYYLEDYAFWNEENPKPIKKVGKEGSPPTFLNGSPVNR